MALTLPPSHRRLRLGPLKLKWRGAVPERDGRAMALGLLQRLEGSETR